MKCQLLNLKWAESLEKRLVAPGSLQKGKCKESAADRVRSHNTSRNSNLLHCKSFYIQHEGRCTDIVSIFNQDWKKDATRLLAALVSRNCDLLSFNIYIDSTAWQAQHQQIQDRLNSNQGWDTRKQVLFGQIQLRMRFPCVAFLATRAE
jgi:hypothetical protein